MNEIKKKGKDKKTCIILDTNIWIYRTKLLRSILGAAFLYVLYKSDNLLLGLPEVVELEMKKHAKKSGMKASKEIKEQYSIIEKLIGSRDEYNLPSIEDFEQAVEDRIEELKEKIFEIPFKFSHAKGALGRVMDETAPNSYKNQQFKDSAIWESILEISKKYNIIFITEDKSFFKNRSYNKGLASNLEEEVKKNRTNIRIYHSIEDYLKEIKQNPPKLNEHKIIKLIEKLLTPEIENQVENAKINEISNFTISPFLTESPKIVALNFNVTYDLTLIDDLNEDEWIGTLTVEGECLLDIKKYSISNLQLNSFIVTTPENCPIPNKKTAYSRLSTINSGQRKIKYTFKEPLDL
ncbi:PIN domain-containing protein [Halanaerobium hydrogeniformans]|uniref:DUF4935 domain-containing protein n=1 Tax=Halanaerobium hydrogeniformans TaxID=656519 RepID=E4RNN7_HALHG|nr:PIN domain-containing protein [Halanaerobium hydrogeniformans]ADQ13715.1 hypothetical protein Halsa_0231 [Halanaerobium hydrogeniformans]